MNERYLALLILFLVLASFLYQEGRWRVIFKSLPTLFFIQEQIPLTQQELEHIDVFTPSEDFSVKDYLVGELSEKSSQADIYQYVKTLDSLATSSSIRVSARCYTEDILMEVGLGASFTVYNEDTVSHRIRVNTEDFYVSSSSSLQISSPVTSTTGVFSFYCDAEKRGVVRVK